MTTRPSGAHLNDDHAPKDPPLAGLFAWMRRVIDRNGTAGRTLACLRAHAETRSVQLHLSYRITADRPDQAARIQAWARQPGRLSDEIARAEADPLDAWRSLPETLALGPLDPSSDETTPARLTGAREDRLVFPTDTDPAPFVRTLRSLPVRALPGTHLDIVYAGLRTEADRLTLVFRAEASYAEIDAEVRRPELALVPFNIRATGHLNTLDTPDAVLDTLMEGIVRNLEAGDRTGTDESPLVADARARGATPEAVSAAWHGLVTPGFVARMQAADRHRRQQRRRRIAALTVSLLGLPAAPAALVFWPGPLEQAIALAAAGTLTLTLVAWLAGGRLRSGLEAGLLSGLLAAPLAWMLTLVPPPLPADPAGRLAAIASVLQGGDELPAFAVDTDAPRDPAARERHYLRELGLLGADASQAEVEAIRATLLRLVPEGARRQLRDRPHVLAERVATDRIPLDLPTADGLIGPRLPQAARTRLSRRDLDLNRTAFEAARTGDGAATWRNPINGNGGRIALLGAADRRCIAFEQRLIIDGRITEAATQRACRQNDDGADNRWQLAQR